MENLNFRERMRERKRKRVRVVRVGRRKEKKMSGEARESEKM